jgi:outer membrane protein OmpA-like peptidoglycan-associated protein
MIAGQSPRPGGRHNPAATTKSIHSTEITLWEMPMAEQSADDPNLWKTLFWLALVLLIGVYLLYEHHNDVQKTELAKARLAIETAERRAATARTELDATAEEAEQAAARLTQLRAEHVAELEELEARLAAETDALKAAHAESLAGVKADHGETLAQLQAELATAQSAAVAVERQLHEVAESKSQLERELEEERTSVSGLTERLVTLTEENDELKAKLAAAEAPTEADTAERAAHLAGLQSDLQNLTAARDAAQRTADEAGAALAAERRALADARAELDVLRQQAAASAADDAAAEAELATLGRQVAELQAALTDAREASKRLEADPPAAAEEAHAAALADAQATAGEAVAEARALHSDAAAAGGRVAENGILLNLAADELRFASGTATLPDDELPSLDRIARFLEERPELAIRIEGHTDGSGSAEVNRDISRERAEAVLRALAERGVDPARMTAAGFGATRPIANDDTERGRRENRRVEVYAVPEER